MKRVQRNDLITVTFTVRPERTGHWFAVVDGFTTIPRHFGVPGEDGSRTGELEIPVTD